MIAIDEDERHTLDDAAVELLAQPLCVRADDDDAGDTARDERIDALHLELRIVLRAVQEQGIPLAPHGLLDTVDDLCEEHVVEAGHHNADRRGMARVELASLHIRHVLQCIDGRLNALTRLRLDRIIPVDDARHGRDRDASLFGDVHDGGFLLHFHGRSLLSLDDESPQSLAAVATKRSNASMPFASRL